MDARELVLFMLEWEELTRKANIVAMQIEAAVLIIAKTQTVGNVRASYSKGRKKYKYQEAADWQVGEATVTLFTTIIPQTESVDWRGICKHAGIEDIPFTQSDPSVTVKLLA